jgi:hypothetical protein
MNIELFLGPITALLFVAGALGTITMQGLHGISDEIYEQDKRLMRLKVSALIGSMLLAGVNLAFFWSGEWWVYVGFIAIGLAILWRLRRERAANTSQVS